ncbi:hypothetical protein Tco_0659701 [Tanacetum coccineum]
METDYVGHIQTISRLYTSGDATINRIHRRVIDIQNLSWDIICLTLWHDMALNFNMQEYEAMEKLVVIAVSSCWVRRFNGDGTTTISLTCFSDQVNSLTKDCNELLAELPDKDPYHLPSTLKELEDTAHIFQFHFDGGSTSKRRDFVLDKVFKKTPLLLPAPPVQNTLPTATLAEQQEYMPPPKAHSPALLTTANNEPDINEATMADLQATQPSILDSHTPTGTQEEDKPYELSPVAVEEVLFDVNPKKKVTKISKPKPAEDVAESSEDIHSTPPPMHVAREIPKGNEAGSLQRPSIWKALFKSDPTPESSEITKKSKHDS